MQLAFLRYFIQLTQGGQTLGSLLIHHFVYIKLKCPHHPVDYNNKTALVGYETDLPTSVLQTAGHSTSRNNLLNKRFAKRVLEFSSVNVLR